MLEFLEVHQADIEMLKDIAIRSKAWWGYEDHFMEQFAASSILPSEQPEGSKVVKVCFQGKIIGWYRYVPQDGKVELTDFWLSPEYIGKGFGGKMFQDLKEKVIWEGFANIEFDADPNAAPFYEHMGCRIIGQTLSEWNRFIPRMKYDLFGKNSNEI
jgi:GNAT superfamily N-acetyltransferase